MAWPPADHADVEAAVEGLRVGSARSPKPTTTFPGAFAETILRATGSLTGLQLTSGQPKLSSVQLYAGEVVSSIGFGAGGAGMSGVSHGWAALCDVTGTVRAISADNTSNWTGSTPRNFAMQTPYTVPADGCYYAVLCIAGTGIGQIVGIGLSGALWGVTYPLTAGTAPVNTGNPPVVGDSIGTITSNQQILYAAVG
jgi:hypothetical protein